MSRCEVVAAKEHEYLLIVPTFYLVLSMIQEF
jgi:hypothetical protein